MKIRYCPNCLHLLPGGGKKVICCEECKRSLRGICLACDNYVEGGILCLCNDCYKKGCQSILSRKLSELHKSSHKDLIGIKDLINRAVKYFSRFDFSAFDAYEITCKIEIESRLKVSFKESNLTFYMEDLTNEVKVIADNLITSADIFDNIQPLIDYIGKKNAKS